MMKIAALALPLALAASMAIAQEADDKALAGADKAADVMVKRYYIYGDVYKRPSEIVARLRELGYTNLRDFEVKLRHYEIEARAPDGQDVELEIDPITGAILDIDPNFF